MAKLFCIIKRYDKKKVTDFLPYNKCLDLYNGEDKIYRKTHKIIKEEEYYKIQRAFSNAQC